MYNNSFLSLLESDLISAPGFNAIDFKFDNQRSKLISKNDIEYFMIDDA